MKSLFNTFFILVLFTSCGLVENEKVPSVSDNLELSSTLPSNALYKVSLNDANSLIKIHRPGCEYSIIPIVDQSDTLLYVYNFCHESGWVVVSGDRRIYPFLGEGYSGHIDFANDGIFTWLGCCADDIINLRIDNSVSENEFTKFWKLILRRKTDNPLRPSTKTDPEMKWCVVTEQVLSQNSFVDAIPHLLTTKWGQGQPWNIKLPYDSSDGATAFLGCTAVAVAQMIYYTHFNLGKPSGLYESISCSQSTINGSTTNIGFTRSNYQQNSSIWNSMAIDRYSTGTSYAGDLMLDVGNRLGMSYSGEQSGANISTAALANYNLSYSYGGYSYSTVYNNLSRGLPIIIIAYSQRDRRGIWPFWSWSYSRGHAWIIDGIRQKTTTYIYVKHCEYTENWANESEVYNTFDEISQRYNITDPYESFEVQGNTYSTNELLMNWGYDGFYDDASYSINPEAAWTANGGDHIYQRNIYYDFR